MVLCANKALVYLFDLYIQYVSMDLLLYSEAIIFNAVPTLRDLSAEIVSNFQRPRIQLGFLACLALSVMAILKAISLLFDQASHLTLTIFLSTGPSTKIVPWL